MLLLLLCLGMGGMVLTAAVWGYQSVLSPGEVSVTIPLGTYEIKTAASGSEIYLEDFGRLSVPGKPNLPSRIFSIAIPPGAEVAQVQFDQGEGVVLPGFYQISPSSQVRVVGEENPLYYEQDKQTYEENYKSVYSSDDPFPKSVGEMVRTAGYRKYNLVDVQVTPFSYRPLSGQLTYYPRIAVRIDYTFPRDFDPQDIRIDNLLRTEQTAKQIVLNYDQAQGWYPAGTKGKDNYDFVIITLDALTSSVTPLVDWETGKGRSVNVVTTSWINSTYTGYDLAEKIRNFLRDKYPSDQWGIEDVLLVGHYDDVPMRRCWQDLGYGKPETDFYYAELSLPDNQSWDSNGNHRWGENSDNIDFYNEVIVGRIPWSTPATVLHICQKSVAYEQNDDPAYKKNILLLGAFFWDDTDNAVLMERKVNRPWMSSWTKTRMYEQSHSMYIMDYNLTYNNVRTVWSSNHFSFVNWAGHGSEYASYILYSTGEAFVSTSTCSYLNDDYPAICFADACSNSDTDALNIGQAMMQKGAVGFVGATKVAYGMGAWHDSLDGSSQSLDYFFTTYVTSGNLTQGQAHQQALRTMYTKNLWYSLKYETFEWGALWGNPDLGMAPVITNYPPEVPPQPSGQIVGQPAVEYDYFSYTTDPDNDSLFYQFSWGDELSDWIGPYPSGGTCTASHAWNNSGIYQVKIKAKDVYDRECDWSDSLTVQIYISGDCNDDGVIDVGDAVYLINYLYNMDIAPNPLIAGDVTCDGKVDIADVVYLLNYLFKGGMAPACQ
ncbi:MAG: C25 family cysteine peptidase [Candidatus Zixiibacteriota bacterium]